MKVTGTSVVVTWQGAPCSCHVVHSRASASDRVTREAPHRAAVWKRERGADEQRHNLSALVPLGNLAQPVLELLSSLCFFGHISCLSLKGLSVLEADVLGGSALHPLGAELLTPRSSSCSGFRLHAGPSDTSVHQQLHGRRRRLEATNSSVDATQSDAPFARHQVWNHCWGGVTSGSLLQMLGTWVPVLVGLHRFAPSFMAHSNIVCEYSSVLGLDLRTALWKASSS